MKQFSHISAIRRILGSIDSVLESNIDGHVSFSKAFHEYFLKLSIFNAKDDLLAQINGRFEKERNRMEVEVNNELNGFVKIDHSFQKIPIYSSFTLSNPRKQENELEKNCVLLGCLKYTPNIIDIGGVIGILKNKSLMTSFSFGSPISYISVNNLITHEMNMHETILVLPKLCTFGSIKADIAQKALQKIKLGYFKEGKQTNWFSMIELLNRTAKFGMASERSGNIKVALLSDYNYPKNKFNFNIGFSVNRNICDFYGKFTIDGRIKFKTNIKPNDWLNIMICSETSAKERFNPVLFGWSLDFYQ